MKNSHPYIKYEKTPLWNILKKALYDLEKNQDIVTNTREEYVIGYLCHKITEGNFQIKNDSDK